MPIYDPPKCEICGRPTRVDCHCCGRCAEAANTPTEEGEHTMSDHNTRDLKFRLKQAHKTIGKQGETIHRLRADLAEIRTLNSKIERGELRRLERLRIEDQETFHELRERIKELENPDQVDEAADK